MIQSIADRPANGLPYRDGDAVVCIDPSTGRWFREEIPAGGEPMTPADVGALALAATDACDQYNAKRRALDLLGRSSDGCSEARWQGAIDRAAEAQRVAAEACGRYTAALRCLR